MNWLFRNIFVNKGTDEQIMTAAGSYRLSGFSAESAFTCLSVCYGNKRGMGGVVKKLIYIIDKD